MLWGPSSGLPCYARIQLFPQARGHWEAARRMRVQTGTRDEPVTWRLRWATNAPIWEWFVIPPIYVDLGMVYCCFTHISWDLI